MILQVMHLSVWVAVLPESAPCFCLCEVVLGSSLRMAVDLTPFLLCFQVLLLHQEYPWVAASAAENHSWAQEVPSQRSPSCQSLQAHRPYICPNHPHWLRVIHRSFLEAGDDL